MTNFNHLVTLVQAENTQQAAKAASYMDQGVYEHADDIVKKWSTETRWTQYTGGKITRDTVVQYATQRINRSYAKHLAKKLDSIESAENAPEIKNISIRVHWTKSPTWGYNPTATVTVYYTGGGYTVETGKASGCGYDKRSAAVASALNKIPAVLKALYQVKENALVNGYTPDAAKSYSNADCIAYGAGYGALPYYEGGVGISSTLATLQACGFTITDRDESGKHDDFYRLEK